jgi:hypothetical protein
VILFQAQGGTAPTGWTETYWSGTANLQVSVDAAVNSYVPKRAALLGLGARIQAVKATSIPSNRSSFLRFLVGKEGDANLFTAGDADAYDPTQVDLLCRVETANFKRRSLWIAGLPDSVTNQLLATGITGAFTASPAWKQFVAAIQNTGFQIRYKDTNGPPPTYMASEITRVQPIMVRNRKRGRPFFLFRGRRNA